MASTGHDNYKTKTRIDFTEINTSKPLSLKDSEDNINTFDNVFGGLNKIIRAIINKIKSVDDDIALLNNADERYYYFDCATFGEAKTKITIPNINTPASVEFVLPDKFTHGFMYSDVYYTSGTTLIGTEYRNPLTLKRYDAGGKSLYGIEIEATLDNSGNTSKITITASSSTSSLSYPYVLDISGFARGEFYK